MSSKTGPRIKIDFRKLFLQQQALENGYNDTPIDDFSEDDADQGSIFMLNSTSSSRLADAIAYNRETAELGTNFAKAFTALGFITLCINLVILAILITHKRLVLTQVFYLLIINFAIIDVSKGICLASHALRFVLPPSANEDRKVLATRIDQYVNIFFRLFNLATIFNLLMITLNEFIYIKFPLRYHSLIRRRLVLTLVFISWIVSIVFTVASSVAKSKDDTVFISTDTNSTESNDDGNFKAKNIRRTETTDLNTIFMFALTGFCVFSLFVVLICYAVFFKVIREIQKHDRRLFVDANIRRPSEVSVECNDLQHFDDRKLKRQLLRRYKYVLVIGSVILVYMLYLISYSSIQILQYFNLNRGMSPEKLRSTLITRWILVLLCGLHSTIQPICYFRMREFREIVVRIFAFPCDKCSRRRSTNGFDRSEYFSSVADVTPLTTTTTATHSHHHPPPQMSVSNLRHTKTAPMMEITSNYQDDENQDIRIPSSLRQSNSNMNSNFHNGGVRSRKQSVVHFEEGTALLVATLSRRPSGFLTGNEML